MQDSFEKKMLLEYEISMIKIGRSSTKLGLLTWWFPSLYSRGPIPLVAWLQPSVTHDHHFWSLHKGNLWMSPQHTLQIDPMWFVLRRRDSLCSRDVPAPDNKSRRCCCRNSLLIVINPDYNMTKELGPPWRQKPRPTAWVFVYLSPLGHVFNIAWQAMIKTDDTSRRQGQPLQFSAKYPRSHVIGFNHGWLCYVKNMAQGTQADRNPVVDRGFCRHWGARGPCF